MRSNERPGFKYHARAADALRATHSANVRPRAAQGYDNRRRVQGDGAKVTFVSEWGSGTWASFDSEKTLRLNGGLVIAKRKRLCVTLFAPPHHYRILRSVNRQSRSIVPIFFSF